MSSSAIDRLALYDPATSQPVLVVGSVAFDNIETPYARGHYILGGSASYACLAASYFTETRMVGVVGKDFGEEYTGRLERHGIDLTGLQRDESGDTFFWAGKYHENFQSRDTVETRLNVFEHFRPELPAGYAESPYTLLANISPDLLIYVRENLTAPKFVIADTMNLWIDIAKPDLLKLITMIDMLVLNDEEAEQITGERNMILGGRKLLEMGPRMVIVKKGAHGAYLFHPDGLFALPAYPVTELRDPTGAGDSFAGALLGYLAAKDDTSFATLKQAMTYATAAASLTVEAFSVDRLEQAGAQALEARRSELLSMISV